MTSISDGLDTLWNRVGSADLEKHRFVLSMMVTWFISAYFDNVVDTSPSSLGESDGLSIME